MGSTVITEDNHWVDNEGKAEKHVRFGTAKVSPRYT